MQRSTYRCFHLESSWWTHSGEGRSCPYRPTTSVKSTCWVQTTEGTTPSSDAAVTDSEFIDNQPMCLKLRLANLRENCAYRSEMT